MALIVEKYGGTSVGSVERIKAVAANILKSVKNGDQLVVVVSAMSGETNRLIALAGQISARPSSREMDTLITTGEQVTIALLSMSLQELGAPACSYTGFQVPIVTDGFHGKARIENIDTGKVRHDLARGQVVVIAGFQGISGTNHITTLGRGGSDTTAVAMAAALKADECRIFTDVDGVYTADPKVVDGARRLDRITFEEMLELSGSGAKVMQIRSVEFASKYNVPLRVLSSFEPGPGTLISDENNHEDNNVEKPLISGITSVDNQAKVTIRGVPDKPGIAWSLLGPISDSHIIVDMIVQNIGLDGLTDFTFTINRDDLQASINLLQPIVKSLGAETLAGDTNLAKISVVGVGMRSHAGIATRMFQALSEKGINIQMISTSEIKISVTIDREYAELAVRALHNAFELDQIRK